MICGKPMFRHVFERAKQCPELRQVVLATDDERIRRAAQEHDVPVVMTRGDHRNGTSRVMEAAGILQVPRDAVVVNIQGDEPALNPNMLSALLQPFVDPSVGVATLAREIDGEQALSSDRVKVVFSNSGRALYFSRQPIPYHRGGDGERFYGHIGLYAFRMEVLNKFVSLSPTRLEDAEELEQLRLLENDVTVQIVITAHESLGVDLPEDIRAVEKLLGAEVVGKPKR
jgi:3-deoxy-manno-octulosonate cytidylyltransferase (CMP-KDO synthetase)